MFLLRVALILGLAAGPHSASGAVPAKAANSKPAVAVSIPPPATPTLNLIPDPNFNIRDSRHGGWSINASADPKDLHFSSGTGPQGSNAIATSISSGSDAVSPAIKVIPGSTYTFSTFLDSRGNTSGGNVAFYIRDAKTGVTYQGYGTTEGTNGNVVFPAWIAPPRAHLIQVVYAINSTGISGTVAFARPQLRKGRFTATIPRNHAATSAPSDLGPLYIMALVVLFIIALIAAMNIAIVKIIRNRNDQRLDS